MQNMQTLIPHWHTHLKQEEADWGYINKTDGQMDASDTSYTVGLFHFLFQMELCWN